MATMQDIRKLADLLSVERDFDDDARADRRRENEWVWWEVERRTGEQVKRYPAIDRAAYDHETA